MDESQFIPQPEEIDSVLWMNFDEIKYNVENKLFPNCIVVDELHMLEPYL